MASISPIFRTLLNPVSSNITRLNGGTYSQTSGAATMTIFPKCLCSITPLSQITALTHDISYSQSIARPTPCLLSSSCFSCISSASLSTTPVYNPLYHPDQPPPITLVFWSPWLVFCHRVTNNVTRLVISCFAHARPLAFPLLYALAPVPSFVAIPSTA